MASKPVSLFVWRLSWLHTTDKCHRRHQWNHSNVNKGWCSGCEEIKETKMTTIGTNNVYFDDMSMKARHTIILYVIFQYKLPWCIMNYSVVRFRYVTTKSQPLHFAKNFVSSRSHYVQRAITGIVEKKMIARLHPTYDIAQALFCRIIVIHSHA